MSPFDVILFDVGGVLLTDGWDRKERAAAVEHFKLDAHAFETRHEDVAPAWERGEIDLNRYLDAAIFYEPRGFSRDEFFGFMLAQSRLLPEGAMAILKQLAASNGCLIGALNNEARETNDFRFDKFDLRCYFKVALSSCYVGLRKPDPAMYHRALDIFGSPPPRVLFIDDREENVAGGAAAGMKAIQFTGEFALSKELKRLGVL
ncbi:MAG TPA: HAD-IA family hydrolase [Terracidiphilus sp.]|nr:HAD-IA family hydrolase [Terracidiphilus sp.]